MRAVVATAPGAVEVGEVPDPPADGRAVVAVEEIGVCGTDVKVASGAVPIRYPRVLGHEVLGTIVSSGGTIPEGTRVLLDPFASCGRCRQCLEDRPNLCERGTLMGRDADGGFAQLVAVGERQMYRVPEHLPDREAVVLQVFATCVHAQTLVQTFPGQTAAIVGLGVSGLLHLQLLRERGVERIVGISRSAGKQRLALDLGAIAVAGPDRAEEAVAETLGDGAHLVVECVGEVATLAQAVRLAEPGGTVLAFGIISASEGELPYYDLYAKELDLVGARGARPRDYVRAIALGAAGRVRLAPLLSPSRSLDDLPGLLTNPSGLSGELKVTARI